MTNRLKVSLSPHEKGQEDIKKIMWGVCIALIPAFITSIYFYGLNALKVVVFGMVFCIGIEYLVQKYILKQEITAFDGSAAVTGILLAFNVPSTVPLWQLFAGSLIAIGVSKMAFGGLGNNPFNPALIGRAFMLASFPVQMTTWPEPMKHLFTLSTDVVSKATPLGHLKEVGVQGLASYWDLFIGNVGGCIGEVSALAILIGGIYMIIRKIITWHIPVFYLLGLGGLTGAMWLANPDKYADPLFHILAGGAMLGAWFMATDMVTSPMTVKGQIIFALGGGLLCATIRIFGAYPEGCSYSILIMNALVPLIDKYLKPKRFGQEVNYVG